MIRNLGNLEAGGGGATQVATEQEDAGCDGDDDVYGRGGGGSARAVAIGESVWCVPGVCGLGEIRLRSLDCVQPHERASLRAAVETGRTHESLKQGTRGYGSTSERSTRRGTAYRQTHPHRASMKRVLHKTILYTSERACRVRCVYEWQWIDLAPRAILDV